MDAYRLPSAGTLYSFTVQRYQPPPLFRIDDWSPYAIEVVDLEDGLQVMGMIDQIRLMPSGSEWRFAWRWLPCSPTPRAELR